MPPLSPPDLLAVVLVLFAASFAQGLTGFGFGVVSMALLPLLLPIKAATPLVSLLNTVLCIQLFWTLRRSIRWRDTTPLMAGLLLGLPIGIGLLAYGSETWLKRLLGIYLIVIALRSLWPERKTDLPPAGAASPAAPLLTGIACGGLAGAFNIGGPPLVAYIYRQPWKQVEMNATLQAVFLVSCVVRASAYAAGGLLGWSALGVTALSLPILFLGAAAGHRLVPRVDPTRMKKAIFVTLGLLGLAFL